MKEIRISDEIFNADVSEIFNDCISSYRIETKDVLKGLSDKVVSCSDSYKQNMPLYSKIMFPAYSEDEKSKLVAVYDDKFVKYRNHLENDWYSTMLRISNGICPFCDEDRVKTLDHYLSKTGYPFLVITPLNLIPCCSNCNRDKDTYKPDEDNSMLFHPYFDHIDFIWLMADVSFYCDGTCGIDYLVKDLDDQIMKNRLMVTMDVFDLKRIYAGRASSRLRFLKQFYREEADELYISREIRRHVSASEIEDINSWDSALFRAIELNINSFINWIRS